MTTQHRIPSGLFLAAGRSVEEALRRDTAEAIRQFKRDGDLIATWEDGKVVLLYGPAVPDTSPLDLLDVSRPGASAAIRARGEGRTPFLDLVIRVARKIYLSETGLHIEFPQDEREVGEFLNRPENQDVLRDICRELTGREMSVHLTHAAEPQPAGPRLDLGGDVISYLIVIIAVLRAAGDELRAAQVREVMADRAARYPHYRPDPSLTLVSDAPGERSLRQQLLHEMARETTTREEDDLPGREVIPQEGGPPPSSRKSKE